MTAGLALVMLLLVGAAVQAVIPTSPWTGQVAAPVLPALVVYFSLYRGGTAALVAAVLAGLFQDSLSLMPTGYSSFGFALVALMIGRYRDVMVIASPLTHGVVTAVVAAGLVVWLTLLLVVGGEMAWPGWWMVARVAGALALGAVCGPLVIALAAGLEERLGIVQGSNEDHGTYRSYYGIG
jgi:rod shape-determining protein MreD